jgi:hypothetical protein
MGQAGIMHPGLPMSYPSPGLHPDISGFDGLRKDIDER